MRSQAETSENYPDKVRLKEAEEVEKLLAERDASSALLHKVVAALRKIISSREEKKDKVSNMFSKDKRLYEQARSRVVKLVRWRCQNSKKSSSSSRMKWRQKVWSFRLCRAL